MPKKVLVSIVELFWRTQRAGALGLAGVDGLTLDWAKVLERKNTLVADWSKGEDTSLEKKGITVLRGHAAFTGPNELRVNGRTFTADRFIIATGSAPARPPIEGAERAITSDQLLDLKELPARMVIIGGGVIAMEFAFVFARAGTRVAVSRKPFKQNPAAGIRDETEGTVKLVYDEESDKILGVHILGSGAEDLIHIAAVAMRAGLKRREVGAMHYVFPTLGGAVFDAMAGW